MKRAVAYLTLAVALSAQEPALETAVRLATAGRLAEAEAIFANLEKASPRDPEVLYRFGLVLLKAKKLEAARRRLELAAKLDPQLPSVRPALGLLHDSLGKEAVAKRDAAAAAKEFQEAIRLDPGRAPYYLALAQLFLDHNTPEPAELVLRNAEPRFPKNAEVLRLLGLSLYGQGKNAPAIEAFLRAIDADPDAESSYASLEALLPDAGERLPGIVSRLRSFTEKHPESPVGAYLLALAVPAESATLLRRSTEAAPAFWPAYFELHKVFKAEGKWPEAAEALRKTVTLNPGFAPAHYALAEYYNRIGDRARAAQEREIHHQILNDQRLAAEKHRTEAPRLDYQVTDR